MAKRILVPLDKTTDAECVVDAVADMARGGGATVRLLHVAPRPENWESDGRVLAYADQEADRLENEARDYLGAVEARMGGVPVECAVRFGEPVRQILLEGETFGADLIVMSTKRANGLGRLVLGSVAEQVVHKAGPSVILFRAARRSAA
jgi:nucleotide-binding universal stress UspA family protein